MRTFNGSTHSTVLRSSGKSKKRANLYKTHKKSGESQSRSGYIQASYAKLRKPPPPRNISQFLSFSRIVRMQRQPVLGVDMTRGRLRTQASSCTNRSLSCGEFILYALLHHGLPGSRTVRKSSWPRLPERTALSEGPAQPRGRIVVSRL